MYVVIKESNLWIIFEVIINIYLAYFIFAVMMVGIYDEGLKAEQAATAVESVVDSLIKANY